MFPHRFRAPASRELKQNTRDRNSGCLPGPAEFSGTSRNPPVHKSENLGKTFDTEASNVLSNVKSPDRAVAAQSAIAGKPVAAAGRQAPSFAALLRAHVFIQSSVKSASVDPGQRPDGPARADMGSLRDRWWRCEDVTNSRSIGLLDGLSTTIRFRLSSLSAGPDAMDVGVVFAGRTIPPDGLSIAHAYPVAGPLARSGRDGVGVVCLCLGSSGWSPLAAMMPILRKSVGGDRPQFPVRESIRYRCLAPLWVLATLAYDESA
jgi:hypothetical protein